MKIRTTLAMVVVLLTALFVLNAPSVKAQAYSVSRAVAYRNARDWQGLLRYSAAWTQAEPNNIDAWGFLANAYGLGLNEPDKAIVALRHCTAIQPNSAPAWHALGVTYVMAKQYGPAVEAIKRAIQLNPNQPTYYNNLAAAYSEGGAWKSALATLDQEKPLAERLNQAKVWYVLANAYTKLGDLQNAIPAYRHLLQIEPGLAQGWTNLGAALQFNGDSTGAKAAYRRGEALGDPLAGKDAAMLLAAEQQAQSRSTTIRPGSPNVSHMYDYYHDVQAGTDISRTY